MSRSASEAVVEDGAILRNRCYIHKLPVEILAQIFLAVLHAIPQNARFKAVVPLVLTHVCPIWCGAAIESKALWTVIPIVSTSITRLYLKRSHPLTISVQYSYSKFTRRTRYADAFRCVLDDPTRVRELIHEDNWDDWFDEEEYEKQNEWDDEMFCRFPAPSLGKLQLVQLGAEVLRTRTFNDVFFPALIDLRLDYCVLPSGNQPMTITTSSLTYLDLYHCENFLAFLAEAARHLSSLRGLKINEHFMAEPHHGALSPIEFSGSLRLLALYSTSMTALSFFQASRIPLHSTVHVTSIDNARLEGPEEDIFARETSGFRVAMLAVNVFDRISQAVRAGYTSYCMTIADVQNDATEIKIFMRSPRRSTSVHDLDFDEPDQSCITSLILAHRLREYHIDQALTTLLKALAPIKTIPGLRTVPTLAISLSSLHQTAYQLVCERLSECAPQTTEIALGSPGLITVLGEAESLDVFPSLKMVSLTPDVAIDKHAIMEARGIRKGLRFVRQDLLAQFPDHSLPLENEMY
ncbi:hypothetical protein PENSPDRAFT_671382 [Peniophora sp. CONT]|nr:hypothetical protein PENSPDRAFT_671382 [Peniophora sp. CONT]